MVTLLVYAQACRFGCVLIDDPAYISNNPTVQAGLSLRNVGWSFSTFCDGNWIPLTLLSLMLDSDLYGAHPGGFHFTNVVLHVLNTVLVFLFLAKATNRKLPSALVAALFALHPLHVESVAWIAERKDVLSIFFGLYACSPMFDLPSGKIAGPCSVVSCCSCAACSRKRHWSRFRSSCYCSITGPYAACAPETEHRFCRPESESEDERARDATPMATRSTFQLVIEKVPFLAVAVAFSVVAVFAQSTAYAVQNLETMPLRIRLANAAVAYVAYLDKTFYPHNLAVFYPHPGSQLDRVDRLGVVGHPGGGHDMRRHLVPPPPVFIRGMGVVSRHARPDDRDRAGRITTDGRPLYLFPVNRCLSRRRLDRLVASQTIRCARNRVGAAFESRRHCRIDGLGGNDMLADFDLARRRSAFQSRGRFGSRQHVRPEQTRLRILAQGKLREAVQEFERAARLEPRSVEPEYNLGVALAQLGEFDQAIAHYRKAIAINDLHASAHNNLGLLESSRGQFAAAKAQLRRAIEISPDYADAQMNLALVCLKSGDAAGAISSARHCAGTPTPFDDLPSDHRTRLEGQGRTQEAIRELQDALTTSPNDAGLRTELARLLSESNSPAPH